MQELEKLVVLRGATFVGDFVEGKGMLTRVTGEFSWAVRPSQVEQVQAIEPGGDERLCAVSIIGRPARIGRADGTVYVIGSVADVVRRLNEQADGPSPFDRIMAAAR